MSIYCKKKNFITVLIIVEIFVLIAFSMLALSNDFPNRVAREHCIRNEGKMSLTTGVYQGETDFGYFDGEGTFTFEDGDVYSGEWKENHMVGSGKYTYDDGDELDGTFTNDKFVSGTYVIQNMDGEYRFNISDEVPKSIIMKLEDGTTYEGELKSGNLNGHAEITYYNGDSYVGNIADGKKNGKGTYTWSDGSSYDGTWKDDMMCGEGMYFYSQYSKAHHLEGEFLENRPDGSCKYYVTDTEYYITEWVEGKCVDIYE